MNEKSVYVVLSQTGTILSRLLKVLKGKKYNHSSISLNKDLSDMCSFGRLNAYNPFIGGFVHESVYYGTFKRFNKTQVLILEIKISEYEYDNIIKYISSIEEEKSLYKYDVLGLLLAGFHVNYERDRALYCSKFVMNALNKGDIEVFLEMGNIAQPMDFMGISGAKIIYQGQLVQYPHMYKES